MDKRLHDQKVTLFGSSAKRITTRPSECHPENGIKKKEDEPSPRTKEPGLWGEKTGRRGGSGKHSWVDTNRVYQGGKTQRRQAHGGKKKKRPNCAGGTSMEHCLDA